jgi:N-acetylmuramoyl-L-alanine amidase
MKFSLTLLIFFAAMQTVWAQQSCPQYEKIIKQGDDFLAVHRYTDALNKYLTAQRYCGAKLEDAQVKIRKVFEKINALKKRADNDRDNAQKAEMLTLQTRDSLAIKADQLARYSDSLGDLRRRSVYERDSLQKDRIRELQSYSKLVDSLIREKKDLQKIASNLQEIIEKESVTSNIQQQQLEEEPEHKIANLYKDVMIPDSSSAMLTVQGHFLTGENTIYALSPNASRRLNDSALKAIVIHVTEGPRRATVSWFQNSSAQASTHIVIDTNGAIIQMVPFNYSAWHAGRVANSDSIARKLFTGTNANSLTIGIDLVGYSGKSFTPKQLEACKHICVLLTRQYHIENILTHMQINFAKNCPGPTFPIEQFRTELFGRNAK